MKTKELVDPNVLYREQLLELGTLLLAARQQQGQTLEAMATKTLIRPSLLAAIEQGDLDGLPEPVYIRGLIRRYGDALHLDGETLASQFFTPRRIERRSWQESPAAQLRPLHLYGAYFMLMLTAISGLSYVLRQTAPEVTMLPPLAPLGEVEPNPATSTNAPPPASEPAEPQAPIKVKMTLTSQSWLRITSDGTTEFEGILQPGDTRLWLADQALTIRAGNAGAVMVSYNDNQAEALGQPGMVREVTYSSQSTVSLAW
ncbi:helix-turn-helix domain-containing protein [Nodosilinea sp. LEGE 07088]|uniref:helix-turn-helix domain-containing protein n=1 Tax=Nodosilinea sp. LEGE 07088 TaxID=2777968 RepID=UPI00187EA974|nr:RodZ domain-containing protein [Nodosilinea sp. LEGE 07088]MBE9136908.1 helix-turn-helix domain-containing protein [Nodosilinea sp. LEGE 07088]